MMSRLGSHVGEATSKNAIEAAQDPQSSMTSEDAQKKITEDAKKAGVAAYQFDPDATPEQKAAQARAVGGMGLLNCHSSN